MVVGAVWGNFGSLVQQTGVYQSCTMLPGTGHHGGHIWRPNSGAAEPEDADERVWRSMAQLLQPREFPRDFQ